MNETIQQIIIELKHQKKTETFPDHICAQANRIAGHASGIYVHSDAIKFPNGVHKTTHEVHHNTFHMTYLKVSLIQTAAACIRMIEEIEKMK